MFSTLTAPPNNFRMDGKYIPRFVVLRHLFILLNLFFERYSPQSTRLWYLESHSGGFLYSPASHQIISESTGATTRNYTCGLLSFCQINCLRLEDILPVKSTFYQLRSIPLPHSIEVLHIDLLSLLLSYRLLLSSVDSICDRRR